MKPKNKMNRKFGKESEIERLILLLQKFDISFIFSTKIIWAKKKSRKKWFVFGCSSKFLIDTRSLLSLSSSLYWERESQTDDVYTITAHRFSCLIFFSSFFSVRFFDFHIHTHRHEFEHREVGKIKGKFRKRQRRRQPRRKKSSSKLLLRFLRFCFVFIDTKTHKIELAYICVNIDVYYDWNAHIALEYHIEAEERIITLSDFRSQFIWLLNSLASVRDFKTRR